MGCFSSSLIRMLSLDGYVDDDVDGLHVSYYFGSWNQRRVTEGSSGVMQQEVWLMICVKRWRCDVCVFSGAAVLMFEDVTGAYCWAVGSERAESLSRRMTLWRKDIKRRIFWKSESVDNNSVIVSTSCSQRDNPHQRQPSHASISYSTQSSYRPQSLGKKTYKRTQVAIATLYNSHKRRGVDCLARRVAEGRRQAGGDIIYLGWEEHQSLF